MKSMMTTVLFSAMLAMGVSTHEVYAGELIARGSDSTMHLVKALADAFKTESGTTIKVEGGGSGKGAKDCIAGEVGLAFLSRSVTDEETKAGLKGVPYALDGVAVIVNQANAVDKMTIDDLKAYFSGEKGEWPDGKPVVLIDRNASSGTRECFLHVVLKKTPISSKAMVKHDGIILSTVQKIATSIAFTSLGEVDKTVKTLTIEGVVPSAETIRNNTYPLARTLTLATKGEPDGDAKAFVAFATGDKGKAVIEKAGYVLLVK